MSQKIYQMITDQILTKLDQGVVPWRKPWNAESGSPKNLISKKPYRGINPLMLSCSGFASPWWLSFRQIKQSGGKVLKGQKGTPVIFWKFLDKEIEKENGEAEIRKIPMLRYYLVWNLEQTEGINPKKIPTAETREDMDPIEAAEAIVAGMPNAPEILFMGTQACYSPGQDQVWIPKAKYFHTQEEYYSAIFHELTHATGHKNRLNRPGITERIQFGSENYSKEELVAEMGSAMLCGIAGIENSTIDNSAAYIDGWRKKISEDPKLVILAAAQAQKAADHILGREFQASSE